MKAALARTKGKCVCEDGIAPKCGDGEEPTCPNGDALDFSLDQVSTVLNQCTNK